MSFDDRIDVDMFFTGRRLDMVVRTQAHGGIHSAQLDMKRIQILITENKLTFLHESEQLSRCQVRTSVTTLTATVRGSSTKKKRLAKSTMASASSTVATRTECSEVAAMARGRGGRPALCWRTTAARTQHYFNRIAF